MAVEIHGTDRISRCLIYPKAFDENGIHQSKLLWQFGSTKQDGASHESAVLRRLAPQVEDVHRIGCKIAEAQNARIEAGRLQRYYCGCSTATVSALNLDGEGYHIILTNIPEGGESAHVDVALYVTVDGKSARNNKKTEAGMLLAEVFETPEPHKCLCDIEDENHPINKYGVGCLMGSISDKWPGINLGTPILPIE